MSNRKATFLYGFLVALASLAAGMVIASRLDLTPSSYARELSIPATNSEPLSGPLDASTFRNIAHEQNPVVVSIQTTSLRRARAGGGGFLEDFFQQPRGRQAPPPQPQRGAGSGFIIDKSGFILTNNHVVEDATEIRVFPFGVDEANGENGLLAKVVGRDVLTDSALLQLSELPETPLTEAKFGDSSQIQPGDWVVAIGNPFGFSNSVTVGVVSAVSRTSPELRPIPTRELEMIQTDAAINRGNSGGPLLNIRGEVVGINTAIISDQAGGNLGIGFAVPINTVREILPQLRTGKVVRGRIGVQVSNFSLSAADAKDMGLPAAGGALITLVDPGPARDGGMKASDVVVEFNGKPIRNSSDLIGMVTRTTPGTTVPVKVVRGGKAITLNIKVAELDLTAEVSTVETPEAATPEGPTEAGLGLSIEALTPSVTRQLRVPQGQGGAVVAGVESGSAADGPLRRGDVILAINGTPVSSVDDVTARLERARVGSLIRVLIWRGGQEQAALVRKR